MDNLNLILENKKNKLRSEVSDKPVKINLKWETASEFCKYCGFNVDKKMVVFILGLCKRYGDTKVYSLKSWVKDYNYDPDRLQGLLVWKLKKDLADSLERKALTTSY